MTTSITCPVCGRTSYNPNDVLWGYCGFCHDWTTTKGTTMKVDSVTHFTDEIGVVEISTFRDEMTLVIPSSHQVSGVIHLDDQTYVHLTRREEETV